MYESCLNGRCSDECQRMGSIKDELERWVEHVFTSFNATMWLEYGWLGIGLGCLPLSGLFVYVCLFLLGWSLVDLRVVPH